MIIIEKNDSGKVTNVGRKFALEQINSLTPEAMAAGFGATIRELEAQIDAFIPVPPEEPKAETGKAESRNETSPAPAKKPAAAKA